MKIQPQIKKILTRAIIFVALFVLVSGIIGPWLISTKLLFDFHFYIYGNLGKLVIFSILLFILLARDRIHTIKPDKFNRTNILLLIVAAILTPIFFYLSSQLLTYASFTANILLSILCHAILITIPLLIFLGIFGVRCTIEFFKSFKKEILICLGLSIILFAAIFQIWKLWPYLSNLVLQVQYFLFSLLYDKVFIIPPRGLFVESFAVEIAEACSGLESIFLFTVLYIFICIIDWKKINTKRAIILFPILIIGLIITNIIRVFLLILVGVLINPQIMAALFHTYMGLILFVIYFFLFLRFGYTWIKKT